MTKKKDDDAPVHHGHYAKNDDAESPKKKDTKTYDVTLMDGAEAKVALEKIGAGDLPPAEAFQRWLAANGYPKEGKATVPGYGPCLFGPEGSKDA
jgi:hypothetical protein